MISVKKWNYENFVNKHEIFTFGYFNAVECDCFYCFLSFIQVRFDGDFRYLILEHQFEAKKLTIKNKFCFRIMAVTLNMIHRIFFHLSTLLSIMLIQLTMDGRFVGPYDSKYGSQLILFLQLINTHF